MLYIKGGGWCYDEQDCLGRSASQLGSTKHLAPTFQFGGVTSDDPAVNPLMAGWNHVVLWYCDGASFTGDKTEPYNVNGTLLYFRGKRVLDAMLQTLLEDHGLNAAEEVLLSGGSAGGLSTYLHSDYVGTKLPKTVMKYKSAPNSGFFSLHVNAAGVALYPDEMKYVYNMQNSSGGVNAGCRQAMAGSSEGWKCIFANYSYAHSTTKMFPLQSALDSWQMGNIWQGDSDCIKSKLSKCTPQEIADLNGYAADLMADYKRTAKWSAAGEGGFVESCLEHVAAQGNAFDSYTIDGVKEVDAFTAWWLSDGTDAAAQHQYLLCTFNREAPHQCNPSCDAHGFFGCDPDDLMCQ